MGILTPFFNLFKPAKTDPQAIAKINEDLDIIDSEMHKPPLTVNGIAPDSTTRDLTITEVPLAGNLSSDIAQINTGEYIERSSGGEASIEDGDAFLVTIKGNAVHTGFVPESIDMTVNAAQRTAPAAITATLDKETFEAYVENTPGTYTLTYTDSWDENPTDYGVTVSNTPVNGDSIVIVWDGENDPTITVNAVTRPVPPAITATLNRATFVAYVQSSGTITLSYTSAWSADPALYGITITNTPINGDSIVIVYVKEDRGTITTATPAAFVSTGWNLYDNDTGYAKVVKYNSTSPLFLIGGTYSLVEFATTVSGTRSALTVSDGYFTIPSDGYVFVTGGNATTYILMCWTDWVNGYEGDFEEYTADTIDLSEVMLNFPYGLLAVGVVRDEININSQTAIQRIQRLAYTDENMAAVIASGMDYDADTNYIYAVLQTPVSTPFTLDGAYTVNDHGIEYVTGTTIPVIIETLYGENLKDKLRTDVVTISPQTLTDAQQTQVRNNLSAASQADITTLNGNLASLINSLITKVATVAKANCNYTYGGVTFVRSGNILMVLVNGFDDLPTGGYNTICTIPEGYRPSYNPTTLDIICGTNNANVESPRILRMRINQTNELQVYNYGNAFTNTNASEPIYFLI
jgi:hypothetical protein